MQGGGCERKDGQKTFIFLTVPRAPGNLECGEGNGDRKQKGDAGGKRSMRKVKWRLREWGGESKEGHRGESAA